MTVFHDSQFPSFAPPPEQEWQPPGSLLHSRVEDVEVAALQLSEVDFAADLTTKKKMKAHENTKVMCI